MQIINPRPVAILLAVYNGAKYLAQQIDSVLAQNSDVWTLYIRDDASSDGTQNIIARYCAQHPDRIVEVDRGGENLGCRNNFFRLLEAVDSDYYMFCDADDVWLPEKVAVLYDRLRQMAAAHPGRPVLAHTDMSIVDGSLNMVCAASWAARRFRPERFYTYNLISIVNPVGGADSGFNRAVKELVFPLADNKLMHDRWLPMVVARNKGIIEPVYRPTRLYRQHGANFYGIELERKGSLAERVKESYRSFLYTAGKLRAAGYGSYGKVLFYRIVAECKRRF